MNIRITTGTTTTIAFAPRRVRITMGSALTGTVTVTDDVPATPELAAATATRLVMTNPALNDVAQLGQFRGVCKVITSTTCDVTVSTE